MLFMREIASLTKIMTAYTVIKIINRLGIELLRAKITVSSEAFMTSGTSADLLAGDTLTVWDVLHGLLLPSGNDAAICLAEYFGFIINGIKINLRIKPTSMIDVFVSEMNSNARELKLNNTVYANPHGLMNKENKSTAEDIAKLSAICMNLPLFSDIVKKTQYKCSGKSSSGKHNAYVWNNTNQLLNKGFNGVKTGNTITAGPCLSASYKDDTYNLIIVVMGCKSSSHKWHEVIRLKNFIVEKKDEPLKLPEVKMKIIKKTPSNIKKYFRSFIG